MAFLFYGFDLNRKASLTFSPLDHSLDFQDHFFLPLNSKILLQVYDGCAFDPTMDLAPWCSTKVILKEK